MLIWRNTAPWFIAALLLKVTSLNTCTRIEKQDVASQRPVGIMKSIAALRNMKFALSEVRLYVAVFLAALRKLLKTKKNWRLIGYPLLPQYRVTTSKFQYSMNILIKAHKYSPKVSA